VTIESRAPLDDAGAAGTAAGQMASAARPAATAEESRRVALMTLRTGR
jgi:hypothetical protein